MNAKEIKEAFKEANSNREEFVKLIKDWGVQDESTINLWFDLINP